MGKGKEKHWEDQRSGEQPLSEPVTDTLGLTGSTNQAVNRSKVVKRKKATLGYRYM